jgi:phosphate uptake regulator
MNDITDPEERKVQLTGGSTYTVSLPKEWAGDQGIEPGCHVNLYSQDDQLVVTHSQAGPQQTDHSTQLSAAGRDPATLSLAVASAYVAGCDTIRVTDIESHEQRRAVSRAIRGLVGLEVMTEDDETLRAQTMLDVEDLSPEQTLAQLERTALEMHEQAIEAVITADGTAGTEIANQDDDVDRLFALLSRGFQQSLATPAVTMGTEALGPFEYYMAARQLERIADHSEKIATIAGRLEEAPPDAVATTLRGLGDDSRAVVRQSLAALVERPGPDTAALDVVIAESETVLAAIADFDESLYHRDDVTDGYLLGLVVDSITRSTEYGVNIAEAGLQARHRNTA